MYSTLIRSFQKLYGVEKVKLQTKLPGRLKNTNLVENLKFCIYVPILLCSPIGALIKK
jgi:hypothetical protein